MKVGDLVKYQAKYKPTCIGVVVKLTSSHEVTWADDSEGEELCHVWWSDTAKVCWATKQDLEIVHEDR